MMTRISSYVCTEDVSRVEKKRVVASNKRIKKHVIEKTQAYLSPTYNLGFNSYKSTYA